MAEMMIDPAVMAHATNMLFRNDRMNARLVKVAA